MNTHKDIKLTFTNFSPIDPDDIPLEGQTIEGPWNSFSSSIFLFLFLSFSSRGRPKHLLESR